VDAEGDSEAVIAAIRQLSSN